MDIVIPSPDGLRAAEDSAQPDSGLAPILNTAPDLLCNLGYIIALSTTKDVSQVMLPSGAPAGPFLSTNMIQIANEGNSAFLGGFKDLVGISAATEKLCREGGLLDQLGHLLIQGATSQSKNLVFSWVQEAVETCYENGTRTASNFEGWNSTVVKVWLAADMAKNTNEADIRLTAFARARAKEEQIKNQDDISFAMIQVSNAIEKANLKQKTFNGHHDEHKTEIKERYQDHLDNPFWAAIKRPFHFAANTSAVQHQVMAMQHDAEAQLNEANRNLAQQRGIQSRLQAKSAHLRAQINECLNKEEALENVVGTIANVCELLASLINDVQVLLKNFAKLSEEVKTLDKIKTHLEKPAGFRIIGRTFNPLKKKATFRSVPKQDADAMGAILLRQILDMKQICLGIHITARLYAGVIDDVITRGFAEALRASYDNFGETDPTRIVNRRKHMMNQWHARAGRVCAERNRDAHRELQNRLAAMAESGSGVLRAPPTSGLGSIVPPAMSAGPPPYPGGQPPY